MRYLFKWTCNLCHRQQVTQLNTGDKWPTICEGCNAVCKTATERNAQARRAGAVDS